MNAMRYWYGFLILVAGLLHPLAHATDLPPDAQTLLTKFHADERLIKQEAETKLKPKWEKLIADLNAIKVTLTKQGDLDAAVAVRDQIKTLTVQRSLGGAEVRPAPETLQSLGALTPGQIFYFNIVGEENGSLWGSDLYTTDSSLAMAAVHAGIVKVGAAAIVKVTIHPGRPNYSGTTQNGVSSQSYGSFESSFMIEAAN